ncbi:protein phosphatase 1 regulatory subunit 3C-B [Mugil cephalus]|uniref:protein phosphatase 1 regulatory subunit 3C-B n=1 Tax=Mugil cephalus TaxID=48193 RepID=UPI001FB73D1E|nr:protein phosphatase 1 regulatory subunit 3C-B [Mugil cephalus]
MSCTRVLHTFSHPQGPVTPVDLAMYLSFGQRQPIYQLLSKTPLKRRCQPSDSLPRTSMRSLHLSSSASSRSSSPVPSMLRSCIRRDGCAGASKKRVVFADAVGLALTAVRVFICEPPSPDPTLVMRPFLAKAEDQQTPSSKLQRHKLRLDFPQPMLDLKGFLARLRETHVQLESCNIADHSLSGKVCVASVGMEKAVHLKVTFDSWRSHHDVPCRFMQQQRCWGSDTDMYTFDLSLPQNIDPKERIEFCVSFRPGPGSTTHWDNNRGQNYRLCVDKEGTNSVQVSTKRFYPSLSKHRPASLFSYVSDTMRNPAELPYLQKSLSNSVRAEWKTLCPAK